MAASGDRGSIFGSPVFKLVVGGKVLTAHRAILEKSCWFQRSFQFREGLTQEMHFPEDAPEQMERVLSWLYTGQLEYHRPKIASHDSKPSLTDAVLLYIVADKYMVHDLTRRIEEMFRKYFEQDIETAFSHHSYLRTLREAGLPDCYGLKKVLLENLAVDLQRHGWKMYTKEVDPGLIEELENDPKTMLKLMENLTDMRVSYQQLGRGSKRLKREHSATTVSEDLSAQAVYTID
ncbi:hypothetical protein G647_04622 [Cladophialophora carrionii CBS 160.54]|uniref:BTB domain-containing protein n=1 Tax=Cladophialophora carrionii CBS 160.54 TaxID=1279043 RepID=V9DFY9_9EURO|nr:uncharacterized protein G647_04622 [Cladophialophora carrionii CBS 160.54]ETI25248.1 hypothetical protein G647_04622 [Cladophialophora carrionii CBS 160.54]